MPLATSACRPSAEALVLTLAVRGALGTRWAPDSSCSWWHCGRPLVARWRIEDKLLAQRIIEESWPELVSACRLGLTLQPQPEWDTPLDGALRARCLNGAKFYIKLTSPAHSVWKGGPTVFRCDGAYMRDAMKCRGW